MTAESVAKLEIYNETKINIPNIVFLPLKEEILGKNFDLTISILESKNSLKINKKQRKQNYTPNTLSFLYSENSGEIILTPEIIKKETYKLAQEIIINNLEDKLIYLFIHSLLHLKKFDHGEEMDNLESKYFIKYRLN